jgi:hypothetical protein
MIRKGAKTDYFFPPSITVNFRRRSGGVSVGSAGATASAASTSWAMLQVRCATPTAFAERQTEHGPAGKFQDEASRPCRPPADDGPSRATGCLIRGRLISSAEFAAGRLSFAYVMKEAAN